MKTIIIVTAAIASLLTGAPAFADPASAAKPAADAASAEMTPAPRAAKPTRYCFVDTVTGSRIPVRTCKTRADWQRQGVEIPANM